MLLARSRQYTLGAWEISREKRIQNIFSPTNAVKRGHD